MAEADIYTIVKVARNEDLTEQIGRDRYFDLVDHNKVRSFRIKRWMPFNVFKEEVAKEFGIPVQFQRFWLWVQRQNHTYRPDRHVTPQQEAQPVGCLRAPEANDAELNLFLEVERSRRGLLKIPPPLFSDDILLFFKLYDPLEEELRYVGQLYVKADRMPVDILAKINRLAGFAPGEDIELFEEIKSEPIVMCEPVDKMVTFRDSQLGNGDIICFQISPADESSGQCGHPNVPSFLEYVHHHQVVRFRSLEKPKEDEFSLELSKVHNYDDVVERVASHLGLDDPSKIRLTSHNCDSQQPKPQPIKYRGVERLSDMLTSGILYYEVLDIPLPELQGLRTLEVAFYLASKDEVVNHTIRLPKRSTVRDILNDLKTKVEMSHPKAELRLLEIFYHKIYKIFLDDEKIECINDQYWTLRAEEKMDEEKNLGPHDRLIYVHHFKRDAAQNQGQVQNFGEPFLLVLHEGETLAEVKVRIQKRLQVPDEEFSEWKFAFSSWRRPEYLVDLDIVSNRFQRRDVYGAWDPYRGLEHSGTPPKRSNEGNQLYHSVPKKSYAANQAAEHVPSEPTHFVNATNRDSNYATPPAGKVRFLSYWVSSEASLLLGKIHCLHKETFVKFSVASRFMQTGVLEAFALFVESMLTAKVNEMNEEVIRQAFLSVKEFEQVGLDLLWLKRRLDEAELVNKVSDSRIFVESCETSLKCARAKVRELEEGLARAKEEVELASRKSPKSLGVNDLVLEGVV